ncbi:MAG: hypothetical protein KC561_11470, partial [Myxococcales bacterium]|nr:hypothetical protein [Myxococcales bacterium]
MVEQIRDRGLARCLAWHLRLDNEISAFDRDALEAIEELVWCEQTFYGREPFFPIRSLAQIALLPNLRMLTITESHICDATPIAHLRRLEQLNLSGNDLKTADGIADLPELVELNLGYNRLLSDVSGLRALPRLARLVLPRLKDLAPLSKLDALRKVTVDSKDLAPLLKLDALRELTVSSADSPEEIAVLAQLRRRGVRIVCGSRPQVLRDVEAELTRAMLLDSNNAVAKQLFDLGLNGISLLWMQGGPEARDAKQQSALHLLLATPNSALGEEPGAVLAELTASMLDAGLDPHARRSTGRYETALAMALTRREKPPIEVVERLVAAQRDWSIPYRYGNPLAIVYRLLRDGSEADKGWLKQAAQLIERHDDAVVHGTAFGELCASGTVPQVQRALELGADVNGRDCVEPPLTNAVAADRLDIAELLLQHGADASRPGPGKQRNAPVHKVRSLPMLELLLRAGANIHQRNASGQSAMATVCHELTKTVRPLELLMALRELGLKPAEATKRVLDHAFSPRLEDGVGLLRQLAKGEDPLDLNEIPDGRTVFQGSRLIPKHQALVADIKDRYGLEPADAPTHVKALHELVSQAESLSPEQVAWQAVVKLLSNPDVGAGAEEVVTAANRLRQRVAEVVPELLHSRNDAASRALLDLPAYYPARIAQMLWLCGPAHSDAWGMTALHYVLASFR